MRERSNRPVIVPAVKYENVLLNQKPGDLRFVLQTGGGGSTFSVFEYLNRRNRLNAVHGGQRRFLSCINPPYDNLRMFVGKKPKNGILPA